ncbi:MAG: hypothetical protein IT376_02230 [Polyangiaceae bacterium]|nr:hypothetical protein [Polyangiaceae bacterium]
MISMDQARQAKAAVKKKLGAASWLTGIGIGKTDAGFCVQVNVIALSEEISRTVPKQIDGVEVRVEAVGNVVRLRHG